MTNPVVAELRDDGAGRLHYRGHRYLLVRPETLVSLQQAVEATLGGDAADCFVAGGREGGGRAGALLPGPPRERVEALMTMGARLGWGRFVLERYGAGELVVTVTGSPFAEAYGGARGPVCHLTRGVIESLAAVVLPGRPRVTETACVAMGAAACRFEARA